MTETNLKRWQAQHEVTNGDLARRARVSLRTIYKARSGGTLSWDTIDRLAKATGLPHADFAPTNEGAIR